MVRQHDDALDEKAEAKLRRFARLHRGNAFAFWLSMLLVFGGIGMGLFLGEIAMYIVVAGFMVAGAMVLQTFLVYPRLWCPRCGSRFFLPNGRLALFARVSLNQKSCVHCGLELPKVMDGAVTGKGG
jgi:hypothetical protein